MVRQVGEDLSGDVDSIGLVLCNETGNSAAAGVLLSPTEAGLIELTLDYLGNHVGAAHEHLSVLRA